MNIGFVGVELSPPYEECFPELATVNTTTPNDITTINTFIIIGCSLGGSLLLLAAGCLVCLVAVVVPRRRKKARFIPCSCLFCDSTGITEHLQVKESEWNTQFYHCK